MVQGRIMVTPGPEVWKRLRAPRTYICNIDLILVIYLLLPSFLRNVVYVKNQLFLHNFQRKLERLYIRGTWFTTFKHYHFFTAISLYRSVRAPIGARALRLQPHQPHGWPGPASGWPMRGYFLKVADPIALIYVVVEAWVMHTLPRSTSMAIINTLCCRRRTVCR